MDVLNADVAAKVANELLRINAVKLQPEEPFTWASGWKSPIYCDNRKTLSFPEVRKLLAKALAQGVRDRYPDADVVAGVATGAIAIGMLVAEELGLPFIYVRPKPKEHGLGNQVEGHLPENSRVVVIEDLISTGGSSLKAVEALRATGAEVLGMLAIFTYGFQLADDAFSSASCEVATLSNYERLADAALASGYIQAGQLGQLKRWREAPEQWGK